MVVSTGVGKSENDMRQGGWKIKQEPIRASIKLKILHFRGGIDSILRWNGYSVKKICIDGLVIIN